MWPQEPSSVYDPTTSHMTRTQPVGGGSGHRRLVGHSGPVYGTCFSVDGKFLISGSEDTTVQLWDLERNASVVCYHGHAYPVWDVTFRYCALLSLDSTSLSYVQRFSGWLSWNLKVTPVE